MKYDKSCHARTTAAIVFEENSEILLGFQFLRRSGLISVTLENVCWRMKSDIEYGPVFVVSRYEVYYITNTGSDSKIFVDVPAEDHFSSTGAFNFSKSLHWAFGGI